MNPRNSKASMRSFEPTVASAFESSTAAERTGALGAVPDRFVSTARVAAEAGHVAYVVSETWVYLCPFALPFPLPPPWSLLCAGGGGSEVAAGVVSVGTGPGWALPP